MVSKLGHYRSIALVLATARRGRFRVGLIGGFALPFHGVQRATGDVDFLADAAGAAALHDALAAAGAECLHRSPDAANYAPRATTMAPVDFIFARRDRALDMLRRARPRTLAGARIRVPVVGAEALVGLKLQALRRRHARLGVVGRREISIVGPDVRDQRSLRLTPPARTLDEFIEFLARLEAVFGRVASPREPSTGDSFRL